MIPQAVVIVSAEVAAVMKPFELIVVMIKNVLRFHDDISPFLLPKGQTGTNAFRTDKVSNIDILQLRYRPEPLRPPVPF